MPRLLLVLLLLCVSLGVRAEVAVPALKARVTDLTGTLSAAEQSRLGQKLATFEQDKGSQLVVLIVPTTAPETIEQYGIRVAEQWQPGRKDSDDGLILIVAKADRTLRIEVGYGLEGVIPDAIARRVIAETIVPRFQAGDFAGGIEAGVDQLTGLIAGETLPPPPARPQRGDGNNPLSAVLIGALFLGQFLRAVLGPVLGGGVVGACAFGLAWFISGSLGLAAVFGIGGFLVTALGILGLLSSHGGGRGGSFGGGGGFGGGGFSGGGGGFGGGGASGRW